MVNTPTEAQVVRLLAEILESYHIEGSYPGTSLRIVERALRKANLPAALLDKSVARIDSGRI